MPGSMIVFTRDLRLADNPALAAAAAAAPPLAPLFVLDDAVLARCREHASRLSFLLDSLRELDTGLRSLGGALTKDLQVDWRQGAAHFMSLLADGDVACNQLNWQWVAGTVRAPLDGHRAAASYPAAGRACRAAASASGPRRV
ncbi:MAG: deoxyribodipyrimidine photo-lyase [Streptosporangiaceae bacterium]